MAKVYKIYNELKIMMKFSTITVCIKPIQLLLLTKGKLNSRGVNIPSLEKTNCGNTFSLDYLLKLLQEERRLGFRTDEKIGFPEENKF